MTLYTATVSNFAISDNPPVTNPAFSHDGSFSTSAQWFLITAIDNTKQTTLVAGWDNASNSEVLRTAKLIWKVTASGISSSRSGTVKSAFSIDSGTSFSPLVLVNDEFGQPASWFGTNKTMSGVATVQIPTGLAGTSFNLKVEFSQTNNQSVLVDYFEIYIDTGNAARFGTLMMPEPT